MIRILEWATRWSVKGILVFTLISFLVCVGVYANSYPEQFSWLDILWFVPAIIGVYGLYHFWLWILKQSHKTTIWVLTAINLVGCLIVLLTYDTQPVSDYKMIWNAALAASQGDFDINDPSLHIYYQAYNWQSGMIALETLIIQAFGPHFYVLKIISCACTLLIGYLVYRLSSQYVNEEAARGAFVLCSFFLPYILAVGQFSNHQIGTVFLLLALYFMKDNLMKYSLLAGVLAGCLNFCRAIAMIVVLAAIVVYVYRLIRYSKKWHTLIHLGLYLSGYFALLFTASFYLMEAKITNVPLTSNNVPYYKFHKGLTPYLEPWEDLKTFDNNLKVFNTYEKQEVLHAVQKEPVSTGIFVADKMVRFLGLYDGQLEHTYNHDDASWQTYPVRPFYVMGWMQYILYVLLALWGYRTWVKQHSINIYEVWFVGNTLVYCFIEAISHYRYEGYIFLFTLGGLGLVAFKDWQTKRKTGSAKA